MVRLAEAIEAAAGLGGDVIEKTAQVADEFAVEAAQFDALDLVVGEMEDLDILDPERFRLTGKGGQPVKEVDQILDALMLEGEAGLHEGVAAGAVFGLGALIFEFVEGGGAGGPIVLR